MLILSNPSGGGTTTTIKHNNETNDEIQIMLWIWSHAHQTIHYRQQRLFGWSS